MQTISTPLSCGRVLRGLAAAVLLGLPVFCQAQTNAEQVLTIGRNVLSMDDYMLSIQYFNQAIRAKPELADPYFYRAIAKLSLDDYAGAQEDCTLALERNPYKTEAYKVRGFARQNLGLDSLAIEDYNCGLAHNPFDKYFLYYKAVAQTESELSDSAATTFAVLLRQYPGFQEGYAARGRLNVLRGDTVAGLADLDHALCIDPNMTNALLMRADVHAHKREWTQALEDMDQVVRLMPAEADLYVNRAYVRYNVDDFFGAMSDYNYALQLEPANTAALFNRGLLRYEVKDLQRAADDMTSVLSLDPQNFHAIYNRGLVWLEMGKPKQAVADFTTISRRYPRFYPAYYALAEAYRDLGDMRTAMQWAHRGDQLVEGYVKDPEHNPLDRPAVARAETNRAGNREGEQENDEETMARFNQLVTLSQASDTPLAYNEKIKGRVQDRNVQVEPEPLYTLSFNAAAASLKTVSNYFRELDDLNGARYIRYPLYLNSGAPGMDAETAQRIFAIVDEFNGVLASGAGRPVDYLGRGVAQTMLKNYPAALEDLDKAVELNPNSTVALMARAYSRWAAAASDNRTDDDESAQRMASAVRQRQLMQAVADCDEALRQNPRLVYAWFNKGTMLYALDDLTSALQCYSEALRVDPAFGEAYYNRGLVYLRMGNRNQAFADLSKAGELGVMPSYSLLKRMK